MNIFLYNDCDDRTPVRIISDSKVMKQMLTEVISGRFAVTEGAAALTVVCVDGEAPRFRGPGIIIGDRDAVEDGIVYLPRPLDICRFTRELQVLSKGAVEHTPYGYVIDSVRRTVSLGDKVAMLTKKEMALFCLLCENCGKVIAKSEICLALWGKAEMSSNACAVYVSYLREKLEPIAGRGAVASVRNGYMLCDPQGAVNQTERNSEK